MTAKQYLRQGWRLKELIQTHKDELEELRSLLGYSPSAGYDKIGSNAPNWNGESAQYNIVIKCVDLENQIEKEIESMFKLMQDIHNTIEAVKNADERLVLRCRYILFMNWDETSLVMNYSASQVRRIHGYALQSVQVPKEYREV